MNTHLDKIHWDVAVAGDTRTYSIQLSSPQSIQSTNSDYVLDLKALSGVFLITIHFNNDSTHHYSFNSAGHE